MANINVVVDRPIADGYKLKFRTPCESTLVEGLEVKYPAKNGVGTLIKKFTFKDAHGTALSGVGNLFVSGVLIEVLLDVTHSVAYIQNADTNSYVESVKGEVQRLEESQKQFLSVAGKIVEECDKALNTMVLTYEDIVSGGYIEALKELNAGNKFSFWVGTYDEFNAIEQKQDDTFYLIADDNTFPDVETALVELQKDINENEVSILNLQKDVADNATTIGGLITDIDAIEGRVETLENGGATCLNGLTITQVLGNTGTIVGASLDDLIRYNLAEVEYIVGDAYSPSAWKAGAVCLVFKRDDGTFAVTGRGTTFDGARSNSHFYDLYVRINLSADGTVIEDGSAMNYTTILDDGSAVHGKQAIKFYSATGYLLRG